MILKWLLFFVALTAHIWLWGQWTLEASMRTTIMLVVPTLFLLVLLIVPLRALFKRHNPTSVFQSYWMISVYYLYVISVIVMGVFHFSGLIQVLLPLIVVLLGCYLYLAYKLKPPKTKPTTPVTNDWDANRIDRP